MMDLYSGLQRWPGKNGVEVIVGDQSDLTTEFHLIADGGRARASLWANSLTYYVARIDVSTPRQNIGKTLLENCLEQARLLKASQVLSIICSRECLESMTTVFGAEHIEVEKRGEFLEPGQLVASTDTEAILDLRL